MTTFDFEGKTIEAEDGETVLAALLRNDVEVSHRCKVGACQSCLLRTRGGAPTSAQAGIDDILIEHGAFLSCQAKAKAVKSVERLNDDALPRREAILVSRSWAAADVLIIDLQVEDWEAAPGRFIRLHHPSGVSRPYSLATPAWIGGLARLHVRVLPDGEMSQKLTLSQPGDVFELEGPFGRCCYKSATREEPMLLIGSGTGLAPLFAIATDAIQHGHRAPIDLYHGGATSSRLYYRQELTLLQDSNPAFRYVPCADEVDLDGDRLGSPLQNALADHPNLEGFKVYLCGHPQLVRQAQKKCFLAGANLRDIAADPFEAA